MENLKTSIENHYNKNGLYDDIINRLEEQDIPLDKVSRSDISGVDEFHVRGAEVSKELANTIDIVGLDVLDVGCGLGGPCRMLSEMYGCRTTGIDLSQDFIYTAIKLSELVNLTDKTRFYKADAINLPFENESYDVVWTQHVQMNIAEKEMFYTEINRVLKPNGYFMYYEILKKGKRTISYPMPWAEVKEQSFLMTFDELNAQLSNMGMVTEQYTDQTQKGIEFFVKLFSEIEKNGLPQLGLNILMGESTKPKLKNLLHHLINGNLELISGVVKKLK